MRPSELFEATSETIRLSARIGTSPGLAADLARSIDSLCSPRGAPVDCALL
jgi:hypothetical protein